MGKFIELQCMHLNDKKGLSRKTLNDIMKNPYLTFFFQNS